MTFLNTKKKKTIALVVASTVVLLLIGALILSAATQLLPRKADSTSSNNDTVEDDTSIQKTIDKALDAESKNKYPEAIDLYKNSLKYYEAKSDQSIHDQNQIANIEARLKAIDAQLQQAKNIPVAPTINADIPGEN